MQILWFDDPFKGFQAQENVRFSQTHPWTAKDAACTCACTLLRFYKVGNSGRYAAISVMVSTVLLSPFTTGHLRSRPVFTFADGGQPSV